MDPFTAMLVGSLTGTAAGLFNDQSNRDFNAEEAQANRDFQREEREATQQFNLDMWNMNNEYNSMSSQVQRAREAGFSPDAIFGSPSNSSPVTSSPMPGAQASFASQMSPVLANFAKTVAETDLLGAEKNLRTAEATGKQLENDFFSDTYEERVAQVEKATRGMELENLIKGQEFAKLNIDVASARESFKWLAKFNEAEYKTKMTNLNNLRIQFLNEIKRGENLQKEGKLLDEKIETENSLQTGIGYENTVKKYRAEFSKETGIALDTSEFEFQYQLWEKGKFPKYCDEVIKPGAEAKFKPQDWYVTTHEETTNEYDGSATAVGVDVVGGRESRRRSSTKTFDSRKGTASPTIKRDDVYYAPYDIYD